MKEHQEYTRIVAAIPHSVGTPAHWKWSSQTVRDRRDRWTDWFTDELFASENPCVAVVKATLSRLDCDAERLEDEEDRLCNFARVDKAEERLMTPDRAYRNAYLSEWYRYRAEVLLAAETQNPLVVDCHSFPSDEAREVDICLGYNEDESKPSLATLELVAQIFREAGYRVAFNHPYANALAPKGYIGHSLMIEVNKQTYMNEQTLQKSAGFTKLKAAIETVYRALTSCQRQTSLVISSGDAVNVDVARMIAAKETVSLVAEPGDR